MADTGSAVAVRHANAIVTFEEMERMATAFAKSNLFGVKTTEAALSLLMIAQAEGIHPALAVMEYDIIEGKPARKAERLLARFQLSGGKVEWITLTDKAVKAKFSHPQGSQCEIEWTIEMAQRIKYYTKDGWKPLSGKYNWQSYPRPMLRSRVISEGVRTCFPGASLVTLSTEEAMDGTIADYTEVEVDDAGEPRVIEGPKTSHKGKKDGDADWINAQIDAFKGPGCADDLYASDVWRSAPKKWKSAFADKIEVKLEALAAQDYTRETDPALAALDEPTPGLPYRDVHKLLDGVSSLDELQAWAENHATPDRLKTFTPGERAQLKGMFKAKKSKLAAPVAAD